MSVYITGKGTVIGERLRPNSTLQAYCACCDSDVAATIEIDQDVVLCSGCIEECAKELREAVSMVAEGGGQGD